MKYLLVAAVLVLILGIGNLFMTLPSRNTVKVAIKPTPTTIPTPTPIPPLNSDTLWSLVQNWRISQNLQTYIKDQKTCDLAELRLPEIESNFSHQQFDNRTHYQEVCPDNNCYFSENLSHGYFSEKDTLDAWLDSPKHLTALKASYKYSCISCDKQYCVQEFANY